MPLRRSLVRALGASLLLLPAAAQAQQFDSVRIGTQQVAPGIAMLTGAGGNIGVFSGADATFVIDDQYAPLTEKIRAAVTAISPHPVRFIVNTHWHGDHTGGNENFANQAGAIIVAHENVRKRMSTDQFLAAFNDTVKASPAAALPVVTFSDTVSFYTNGDTVEVFHVAPAHTDGDAVIRFRHANVVHMGDTFFNGLYPFIDVSSGGSIDGMIAACDRVLAFAGPDTKLIPGHGPLADRKALAAYRDMLAGVRAAVAKAMKGGKSLDEVVKAAPTAPFDAAWGKGFLKPEQFVAIVYADLKAHAK